MQHMWREWLERQDVDWRAVFGTLTLHIAVFSIILGTPVKLEARQSSIIPVVLVESAREEEDEPVIVPELVEESDTDSGDLDLKPIPDEIVLEEPEPPTPKPLPPAPLIEALPTRPLAPTVEQSVIDTDEPEAAEAIVIDPRYKIPFDPFAETAPTAISRFTVATMCARSSRATRPEFCPDISTEDRYYSMLDRPTEWSRSTYDPVFDIVATQSIIEKFAAKQSRHSTRSGSAELEPLSQVPRHPEALPCTPVQTGLQGPSGIASGLELPLGSTDGIQCR
ncbi:MAG: hypothetical protein AAF950_10430 [Pseudomonadota bacterium]